MCHVCNVICLWVQASPKESHPEEAHPGTYPSAPGLVVEDPLQNATSDKPARSFLRPRAHLLPPEPSVEEESIECLVRVGRVEESWSKEREEERGVEEKERREEKRWKRGGTSVYCHTINFPCLIQHTFLPGCLCFFIPDLVHPSTCFAGKHNPARIAAVLHPK